jgi:hypothetical protein
VLTLTLNRPKQESAMNMAGWTALRDALRVAFPQEGTHQSMRQAPENEAQEQAPSVATRDGPVAYVAFMNKKGDAVFNGDWAVLLPEAGNSRPD